MIKSSDGDSVLIKNEVPMWYIVNVYSGFEQVVIEGIKRFALTNGIEDSFVDFHTASVPVEVIERGEKRVKQKSSYPGYIFIKAKMNQGVWDAIHLTPRVVGFVGGTKFAPKPLTDAQYEKMIADIESSASEALTPKLTVGDSVRIKEGSFQSLIGTISSINQEAQVVTVVVKIFGRESNTDLTFDQVEKVDKNA